jgi:predicted nuclease of predicted toxin-antitoxin system
MTVRDQNLQGAKDEVLFDVCAGENRALITLDHDFGHVLRFPPERTAGIVVLELGARATHQSLLDRLSGFLEALETQALAGRLWIVEPHRVRIHLRGEASITL